jgi:hypothetical protein
LDPAIKVLFAISEGLPCPIRMALLRSFSEARPIDFGFLQPQDLIDLSNSAFAGISEWDTLAEHYATCERCHV